MATSDKHDAILREMIKKGQYPGMKNPFGDTIQNDQTKSNNIGLSTLPKLGKTSYGYNYTPSSPYQAPGVPTGSLPEYQLLRDKADQRARVKGQEATSAIDRRFAAMGGLQSGAAIKTAEKARHAVEGEAAERLGQIDVAETAEKRRMTEIQEGREFASSEAEKQRAIQAGQFEAQMGQSGLELGQQGKLKLAALEIAQNELRLNSEIAEFNKGISEAEANRPSGLFNWLLG